MQKFDSISHFLQTGDFNYRIFDMGRKVTPISNKDFKEIEDQQRYYPYPFQKKAWLALLFWTESAVTEKEPVIWFLQFPIDELGYLKLEARDGFLISLLEQTGKNIQARQKDDEVLDELAESPYAFKPQPNRLAFFHALAMKELGREPSKYYHFTREYLAGKTGYEQWQFLGLQGVSDVVARLEQDDNEELLVAAIGSMPPVPLESFCQALENIEPQGKLLQALELRLKSDKQDIRLYAMLVRALSGAQPDSLRKKILLKVLNDSLANEIEVLAAISGRAWKALRSPALLKVFVERLARQDQMAFNALLVDLIMIPGMREPTMVLLNGTKNSPLLSQRQIEFIKLVKAKESEREG